MTIDKNNIFMKHVLKESICSTKTTPNIIVWCWLFFPFEKITPNGALFILKHARQTNSLLALRDKENQDNNVMKVTKLRRK